MAVTPGQFQSYAEYPTREGIIIPGMIVSCSNPPLSGGTVLATPIEDWDNRGPGARRIFVDWGSGNVIWVLADLCTVTIASSSLSTDLTQQSNEVIVPAILTGA